MPDEVTLRELARTAIRNGKLPARPPDRTWGGPGMGALCPVCGVAVTQAELEFEVEFARDGGARVGATYHLHTHCFAAWGVERPRSSETRQCGGEGEGQRER